MLVKSGFKKESIANYLSDKVKLIGDIFSPKKVWAEEDPNKNDPNKDPNNSDPNNGGNKQPTINYEDLIAKARKEEKDKLYPKISALEKDVETWTKKCNEHLISIGQKDAEIEALNAKLKSTGKSDPEEVTKLKGEVEKLTKELEDAKKNVPDVQALEKKIKSEYEVKLYREQKVGEFKEEIIPELVIGTTKEEIDASLEQSKKRFKQVSEKILGGSGKIPASNVSTSKVNVNNFSLSDLANLDPRSPEYAEFRKKLGLR